MTQGLEYGIDFLKDVLVNTSFTGTSWILQIGLILGTMTLITRRYGDWKTLAFPVTVGWHLVGFRMSWILMILATVMFLLDNVTIQAFTGSIGSISNGISGFTKKKKAEKLLKKDLKKLKYVQGIEKIKREIDPITKANYEKRIMLSEIGKKLEREEVEKSIREKMKRKKRYIKSKEIEE